MVSGNFVMIGGSPVGKVTKVELTEDNQVKMEVEIDRELHEGTLGGHPQEFPFLVA